MFTKDVIAYFSTQTAVAEALGIHKTAVSQWGELVPFQRAFELEELTNGDLKLNAKLYKKEPACP